MNLWALSLPTLEDRPRTLEEWKLKLAQVFPSSSTSRARLFRTQIP